jgi:hypothetical protein
MKMLSIEERNIVEEFKKLPRREVKLRVANAGAIPNNIDKLEDIAIGEKVLDAINNGQINFIDNHDGKEKRLDGYVVLKRGNVCPIYVGSSFCLNYLYLDDEDNKIHLSQMSVAGNVYARGKGIFAAIDEYNSSCTAEYRKVETLTVFPEPVPNQLVSNL